MRLLRIFGMLGVLLPCAIQGALAQSGRVSVDLLIRSFQTDDAAQLLMTEQMATRLGLPLEGVRDGAAFRLERVQYGRPIYQVTHNLAASLAAGVGGVRAGGWVGAEYLGQGQTVGVWDAETALPHHAEFGARVTVLDQASSPAGHATHVTGTIAGSGVRIEAKGMAPQVLIDARDWQNDRVEMTEAGAAGLLVSNHSYGTFGGWVEDLRGTGRWTWMGDPSVSGQEDYRYGFYGEEAAAWDAIAFASPNHLIVKSAGNERADIGPAPGTPHDILTGQGWTISTASRPPDGGADGYDSILDSGLGKNVLTVGAVEDLPGVYRGPDDVVMASFSGWGPTDDGRIKPDIVANGTSVLSSVASGPDAYAYSSGTSMAAPIVAGGAALIQEAHFRHFGVPASSATVRGLMTHTAREAGPGEGPDYQFGWGLLDVAAAVAFVEDAANAAERLVTGILEPGQSRTLTLDLEAGSRLEATLAWTDPPATARPSGLNRREPVLLNDLDLSAEGPEGVLYPFVLAPSRPADPATRGLNRVDTIERVLISNVQGGRYDVVVRLASDAVSPQAYSLLIGVPRTGATADRTLAGRLTMAGEPAGGVEVSAGDARVTSAADGTFLFSDLPLGPVTVVPEPGLGFAPDTLVVDIASTSFVEFAATSAATLESTQLFQSLDLMRAGEWESRTDVTSTASGGVYGANVFLRSTLDLAGGRLEADFGDTPTTRSYAGTRAAEFRKLDAQWRISPLEPGRFVKRIPLFWQGPDAGPQRVEIPFRVYDSTDRLVGIDTLRWDLDRDDDVPPIIYPRIDVEGRGLALDGQELVFRADVLDGSELAAVGARLFDRDSGDFIAYARLFDDGAWAQHADAVAGDRLFGTVFRPTGPRDFQVDMEAADAIGNITVREAVWHASSRPFVVRSPYLLLTWSQTDTDTDAHREALARAGIEHDYWEFDVRGQLPDSLLNRYEGLIWSWDDRPVSRTEDRELLRSMRDSGTPAVLAGSRLSEDDWLSDVLGVSYVSSTTANVIVGSSADSVFQDATFDIQDSTLPIWSGGQPALLVDAQPVATLSGAILVSGVSPLRLTTAEREKYLRLALYAVTGDPALSASPTAADGPVTASFSLAMPFPNPAAGEVAIQFQTRLPGPISIEVSDLLGRRVAVIESAVMQTGRHSRSWNTSALPPGLYFVTLKGPDGALTRPVVVARE